MKTSNYRYLSKSTIYKHVYIFQAKGKLKYLAKVAGSTSKFLDDERKAAIFADVALINKGKEPVNILKRKE